MDALSPVIVFLLGVILRLGLPLAVTALFVWLLRTLDAHWQADAREARRRALAPAMVSGRAPCWVINNCSAERRATCPIYGHAEVLCWQYFRDGQGSLRDACLGCEVFRNAPIPAQA
jgi:hypothetical protein